MEPINRPVYLDLMAIATLYVWATLLSESAVERLVIDLVRAGCKIECLSDLDNLVWGEKYAILTALKVDHDKIPEKDGNEVMAPQKWCLQLVKKILTDRRMSWHSARRLPRGRHLYLERVVLLRARTEIQTPARSPDAARQGRRGHRGLIMGEYRFPKLNDRQMRALADSHTQRFEKRLRQAKEGVKGIREDEVKHLLGMWKSISTKLGQGNWRLRLGTAEVNEIKDALDTGDFDDILRVLKDTPS